MVARGVKGNVVVRFMRTHRTTKLNTTFITFPTKVVVRIKFLRNHGNMPWCKLPRKVLYKRTFGMLDQGQTLDVWVSQTTESALRWWMRHIAPRHILGLTLEVILEAVLKHVLEIKTMTSLILDHIVTACLYLGNNTREKVMILFLFKVLELSQDWPWSNKHAPWSSLL